MFKITEKKSLKIVSDVSHRSLNTVLTTDLT